MARKPVPGPLVIPNTVEIRMIWSEGGRNFHNVLHARYTAPSVVSDTLAESLFTNFKTSLTSSGFTADLASSTSFTGVGVRDIGTANNIEYLSTGSPAPGAGAIGPLPANVAICVTWQSAKSGTANRGRSYWGGLDDSAKSDSHSIATTSLANAVAFASGIHTNINSAGLTHTIANRALQAGQDAHGNQLPARAATSVDVIGAKATDTRIDTQRRRLGR